MSRRYPSTRSPRKFRASALAMPVVQTQVGSSCGNVPFVVPMHVGTSVGTVPFVVPTQVGTSVGTVPDAIPTCVGMTEDAIPTCVGMTKDASSRNCPLGLSFVTDLPRLRQHSEIRQRFHGDEGTRRGFQTFVADVRCGSARTNVSGGETACVASQSSSSNPVE